MHIVTVEGYLSDKEIKTDSDCVALVPLPLVLKQVEKKRGYYISPKRHDRKKGILCYYYVDILSGSLHYHALYPSFTF